MKISTKASTFIFEFVKTECFGELKKVLVVVQISLLHAGLRLLIIYIKIISYQV